MYQKKDDSFMDRVHQKTNVNPNELLNLANSVSEANFKDEETVRKLIHQVAALANKRVSKEKEDQLVHAIVNNNMPKDLTSLANMFNKK